MQIHTVYFWLKPGLVEDESSIFKSELEKLIKLETVHASYMGTPAATEDREVIDKSFDFSITLLFNTMEDHNIYQAHPDHLAFVERCSEYWQKVQVYDAD